MDENQWLADRFEEHRGHLRAVAYRMLGSLAEADDAVQDTWLRLSGAGVGEVVNLRGWLTTVTARVCLNMLRSRNLRREEALSVHVPDPVLSADGELQPEEEALLADSVGLALQVVLDTLVPAERLAFVLHDMFGLPFEEIAPMVSSGQALTGLSRGLRVAQLHPALVNGAAGMVVTVRGRPLNVMGFTIAGGRIAEIDAVGDPERVRAITAGFLAGGDLDL